MILFPFSFEFADEIASLQLFQSLWIWCLVAICVPKQLFCRCFGSLLGSLPHVLVQEFSVGVAAQDRRLLSVKAQALAGVKPLR